MNYEKKYLKYKNKYLQLIKQTGGAKEEKTLAATISGADDHTVDSLIDIKTFLQSMDPEIHNNMLLTGRISNVDIRSSDTGGSVLHTNSLWYNFYKNIGENVDVFDIKTCLSYALTCDPPANVNARNMSGCTPIWEAAINYNSRAVKVLIDFGCDRTIECKNYQTGNKLATPLDVAKDFNSVDVEKTETIRLLAEYFPEEEDKLICQLECKRLVDSKFKDIGKPRFNQDQIDLKYYSLERCLAAVKEGNLDILTQSILHVDLRMAVSLTVVAIKRDHINLMDCLFERLVREENGLKCIIDKSIEPILLSGLNATFRSKSPEIVEMVSRSRVLSFFKILYHKFIFLDVITILELVQVMMHESLKIPKQNKDSLSK
jgi:hypothetical protein